MALQNYRERVVFPTAVLKATPLEVGRLVMSMDVWLELERKTILDSGVMIYRHDDMYRLIGNADEIVHHKQFEELIPADLSEFINKASNLGLSITLENF
jgi:hypothetical protein